MKELNNTWQGMRSIKDFTEEELLEQIRTIEALEDTEEWCNAIRCELEVAQTELKRRNKSKLEVIKWTD